MTNTISSSQERELLAKIDELERSLRAADPTAEGPALELLQSLVDSERNYRHLVEHSSAFICAHDMEGYLLSVNRAGANHLGYEPEDLVGRNLKEFLDPDHAHFFAEYLESVAKESTVQGIMRVVNRKGERLAWAYQNTRYDEPGRVSYILGHAQDVTEMKRLEDTLKLTQFSVDGAADAVFWLDANGRLHYVNEAASQYLGYSREELYSVSIYDIDITLERAYWPSHWEQVKQMGRFTTETIYRSKDGRTFPVEVTINFLTFQGLEYHCVFAREISERKEAEEAIIATTARLEGLIENLQVGVLFEDADRTVVLANQALCQMLEIPVPPSFLTGADSRTLLEQCKDLFPPPERFVERVEKIMQAHNLVRNQELTLADGRVFARDYIPIVNQNYRAHLWQYRDVTERKRAEEEILKAKFEAEQANAAKSSFLAMMSHELRTPLNAILGMTELSLESPLNTEQKEFLRTIQSNSENLLRLIDDVLDLSKIEANRMDIEQIPFDLRGVVEEVAESLMVRAAAKDVDLLLDIDPHLPSELVGDPKRVRQILINLVGNAVKFTENGSVEIVVAVEDWKPGDRVDLSLAVRDTGIGIPKDKQKDLFAKFYQAESSTTRRFGGTGLGLNITRSLAELMGGRIDFSSTAGSGSTFRVNLTASAPQDTGPNSAIHRAQLRGTNTKIILSVDNPRRRRVLSKTLKAWGFEVEVAESLDDLRDKSTGDEPSLALLDFRPERIDLESLRELRHPPERELVLLISMGANTSAVLTETCPHLVVRPVRQEKLARTLARALGLRALASQPPAVQPSPRTPASLDLRVLLVEDNPDNQKLARRVLENAGAKVDTAENGEIAVSMAQATLYDLIVMDLMMPVLDGFQATEQIREQETAPNHVPIVALTAHATEGFRDRCLESGMDDYLSKPFKKDRFLAIVDQWADRRPILLIVDDAPANRLIVKRFLMLGGDYRLLFAENGKDALELFQRQEVSIVLLDMEMPVMDGFETAGEMRKLRGPDDVPIVAMTAHTDSKELERCLQAGCTAYIQKPLDKRRLNELVAKHVRERAESFTPRSITPVGSAATLAGAPAEGSENVVKVDSDIQDLVPRFLENQKNNAELILELAKEGNFETIRRLGHNMKGTGKGYGFEVISSFGFSLERAAEQEAVSVIERIAGEISSYISEVRWEARR